MLQFLVPRKIYVVSADTRVPAKIFDRFGWGKSDTAEQAYWADLDYTEKDGSKLLDKCDGTIVLKKGDAIVIMEVAYQVRRGNDYITGHLYSPRVEIAQKKHYKKKKKFHGFSVNGDITLSAAVRFNAMPFNLEETAEWQDS